ncbi:hypothetical protein C0Q70_20336 [Pomacea canaliculata]|uniref:Lipase domain-containing protein n=2 Tax=Pomacea canaliculata TaxID=400727 RepID=A0A2T7NF86_POMCA|nr:hypothetical protein C0Q70_20336 [Pomacea canaliculata]
MRSDFRCYNLLPPYTNTNFHLPQSPTQQNIRFLLYTTANPSSPHLLHSQDARTFQASHFDKNRATKIIVHGFTDSGSSSWIHEMVGKLLQKNVNVIVVDWQTGAKGPNYFQAAANTRVVGADIATLILTAQSLGAAASSFHIIGHSLGSHIAGYAGEKVHGMGRITGLDPAAPLFETYSERVRLDKSDAAFVDVIHTDAQPLHEAGVGIRNTLGHVDFFPNGGVNMPGCPAEKINWTKLLTGQITTVTSDVACSHNIATRYFTASINDNQFQAFPCASLDAYSKGQCTSCGSGCNNMGYHAHTSTSGLFVLHTAPSYPF